MTHENLSSFVADRAKQIKTKATVNEDPTDKLIRELREQNEKLKSQLAGGKVDMAEIGKANHFSSKFTTRWQLLIFSAPSGTLLKYW